jgi:hypothetical protein
MFNQVPKCLPLCKIYIKQVVFIMKQLHFYALGECGDKKYLRDWVNWDGEVPMIGDCVLIHFGDDNEKEYKYRVVGRVIDGRFSNDVDIIVRLC